KEVDATHLVGTVVRAIAGADAPVVHHLVEPLGAVHGGVHRTHQLTGRVLAVHARHRLKNDLGCLSGPFEVAIDAYPVHPPGPHHLSLAHRGDVVLRLAGGGAGATTDAGGEIDHHAPLVVALELHLWNQ